MVPAVWVPGRRPGAVWSRSVVPARGRSDAPAGTWETAQVTSGWFTTPGLAPVAHRGPWPWLWGGLGGALWPVAVAVALGWPGWRIVAPRVAWVAHRGPYAGCCRITAYRRVVGDWPLGGAM